MFIVSVLNLSKVDGDFLVCVWSISGVMKDVGYWQKVTDLSHIDGFYSCSFYILCSPESIVFSVGDISWVVWRKKSCFIIYKILLKQSVYLSFQTPFIEMVYLLGDYWMSSQPVYFILSWKVINRNLRSSWNSSGTSITKRLILIILIILVRRRQRNIYLFN